MAKWGAGTKWGVGTKWGLGGGAVPTIIITSAATSDTLLYALTGIISATPALIGATYRLNGGPVIVITVTGGAFSEPATLRNNRNVFVVTATNAVGEAFVVFSVVAPSAEQFLTSANGLLSRLPSGARITSATGRATPPSTQITASADTTQFKASRNGLMSRLPDGLRGAK